MKKPGNKFLEGWDYFFNKMIPKKFIVVWIAFYVVKESLNPPQLFWWILIAYMGTSSLKAIAMAFRGKIGEE